LLVTSSLSFVTRHEHMPQYIDLSHSIVPGLKTYPDLPSPVIGAYMTRHESKARYASGTTFHIGKIAMVSNTATYIEGHPFLTAKAAEILVAAGAKLVGIDSLNIDSTDNGARPVHSTLLGAGIPIVEHLCNLERLPSSGFRFFATPVKVQGMGSFPVRAFAMLVEPPDSLHRSPRRTLRVRNQTRHRMLRLPEPDAVTGRKSALIGAATWVPGQVLAGRLSDTPCTAWSYCSRTPGELLLCFAIQVSGGDPR
jgi:kynurenine formamidase